MFVSGIGCVVGSLLTDEVEPENIYEFYKRVRPFGFWSGVYKRLGMSKSDHKQQADNLYLVIFNSIVTTIALHSYYMCSIYIVGHFYKQTLISFVISVSTTIILYFSWYRLTVLKENRENVLSEASQYSGKAGAGICIAGREDIPCKSIPGSKKQLLHK